MKIYSEIGIPRIVLFNVKGVISVVVPVVSLVPAYGLAPVCGSHLVLFLLPLIFFHHSIKKGEFLYSTVSSPQDHSKRFTLYFPDSPVHSDTISTFLGSIQAYATIYARRLLVHISTTVCSQVLIYTAE